MDHRRTEVHGHCPWLCCCLVIYHGMKGLARWRGTVAEPETETEGLPPAVKSAMNAAAKRSGKKGK